MKKPSIRNRLIAGIAAAVAGLLMAGVSVAAAQAQEFPAGSSCT